MRWASLLLPLALAACVGTPAAGGWRAECTPLVQSYDGLDAGVATPPPFAFTVGPVPASPDPAIATASIGGAKFMFQAGTIVLDFTSPVAQDAVEPLMRDFGLEVKEITQIPVAVPSGAVAPTPAPAVTSALWVMRIRDVAAISLDSLQADAIATNLRGEHVFDGHDAAAVYAVAARINRRGGCYTPLRAAAPNHIMSPM